MFGSGHSCTLEITFPRSCAWVCTVCELVFQSAGLVSFAQRRIRQGAAGAPGAHLACTQLTSAFSRVWVCGVRLWLMHRGLLSCV